MGLAFGDVVVNEWAGNRNPQKVLMVRKMTQRHAHCVALDGSTVTFHNDKDLRLTRIGTLNLSRWRAKADETRKTPDGN